MAEKEYRVMEEDGEGRAISRICWPPEQEAGPDDVVSIPDKYAKPLLASGHIEVNKGGEK
jgi:hypothetical protein